jgi:hypothetical protein
LVGLHGGKLASHNVASGLGFINLPLHSDYLIPGGFRLSESSLRKIMSSEISAYQSPALDHSGNCQNRCEQSYRLFESCFPALGKFLFLFGFLGCLTSVIVLFSRYRHVFLTLYAIATLLIAIGYLALLGGCYKNAGIHSAVVLESVFGDLKRQRGKGMAARRVTLS